METARWTPDPQLASALDAGVRPYEPLLYNVRAADLSAAVQPLENIMFWSRQIPYWLSARGESAVKLQIPIYNTEWNHRNLHIGDAALCYAGEMSGVNDDFTSTSEAPGTDVRSERFGTRLTSIYTNGESIEPTDPDYVPVGAVGTNFRRLGYQHPKVQGKLDDIRVMLGASDLHEVTTGEDRKAGIEVFEAETNVGATLYQVVTGGQDVYLYAKRDPSIRPSRDVPLLSPDGHAVRLVTDPDIAREMARVENPFWLMQQNARANKLPKYASELLEPDIFWNGEKAYWGALLGHRPYYDDFVERHIGFEQQEKVPHVLTKRGVQQRLKKVPHYTDINYLRCAAESAASELTDGVEGYAYDEWHNQIRSPEYGTILTFSPFHAKGSEGYTWFPYTHPIMQKRIRIVSKLLGADGSRIDVTTDDERREGKIVQVSDTNLGLTLFTTIDTRQKDHRYDVVLSAKRVC
jgi:hypothetical protein